MDVVIKDPLLKAEVNKVPVSDGQKGCGGSHMHQEEG
jgi:hypothetical protein